MEGHPEKSVRKKLGFLGLKTAGGRSSGNPIVVDRGGDSSGNSIAEDWAGGYTSGKSIVEGDGGDEKSPLISVMVRYVGCGTFTLEGFSPSDTFGDIRAAIIRQIRPDHLIYQFSDPKTDFLRLPGHYHPMEDDWTIASVLKGRYPTLLVMRLIPAALELKCIHLPPPETRPPDLPHSDAEAKAKDKDGFDKFFTKRPRTEALPFRAATSPDTVFFGPLEFNSYSGEPISFPTSIDSIEDCESVHTSASVVLLTPSDRIMAILSTLLINDEDDDSRYLIINVGWDRLSFLLLRLIKLYYRHMPFVAVTDLTPHQLDLMTFLDTPKRHMKYLYGWDIMTEEEEEEQLSAVSKVEALDIKWLALKPSDLEYLPARISDRLALPWPHDFDNVLAKLQWNPHFSKKEAWVTELELFKAKKKCAMFQPMGPLKNVILKRLRELDCV